MIRNFLKLAFRRIARQKGYTAINLLGLGISIASCIFIMLFVKNEWSFDRFHSKHERIYRAWMEEHYKDQIFRNTTTPIPLGPVLQAGLPEVEKSCRIFIFKSTVHYQQNKFTDNMAMADSSLFDLFDFDLIQGDKKSVLLNKNAILINKATAKKYFGTGEAMGKSLGVELGNDTVLFTVSGILKDVPVESTLQFDMIIPFSNARHVWSEATRTRAWSAIAPDTYVMLKKGTDKDLTEKKIGSIMDPLVAANYKPGEYIVRLQPIRDMHFNKTLPSDVAKPSDPKYAYIMATAGIILLLIASINFVTLAVGLSVTRAMEVGVRKVLGAERKQLIKQFWGESLLVTLIAMIIGIGLVLFLQNFFNQLANKDLQLELSWFNLLFFLALLVAIGLIAGIYPALILSGFKPIDVLKGKLKTGTSIGFFRKALITGQFTASIVMIIAAVSIGRQLDYLRTKDLGYSKEHIIVVQTNQPRRDGNKLGALYKNELIKNPQVKGASVSLYSMAEYGWMQLGYSDESNLFHGFTFNAVDPEFLPMMGLQTVAGRGFLKNNPEDSNYILVNEALVKAYGWKEPIGQRLHEKYTQTVIGVVKDFNIATLRSPIDPAVIAIKADSMFRQSSDMSFQQPPRPRISVRFAGGDPAANVDFLRKTWKSVAGDRDFEFRFLDDALNEAYAQEQRLSKIIRYASLLSIFVACLGLLGLATLVVVRRTKEIGIRKVLGADVNSLVAMLSKEFLALVTIAALIAFPLAWWGLHKWLEDFAYRIPIPWIAFILAAVGALVIAFLTISFQAIKAALTNPVKSLRTE